MKHRTQTADSAKMPLTDLPLKREAIDLIGPMTDQGNRYILTMVDYAMQYPEATALKSTEAQLQLQSYRFCLVL